jgi:hypothetical protein
MKFEEVLNQKGLLGERIMRSLPIEYPIVYRESGMTILNIIDCPLRYADC